MSEPAKHYMKTNTVEEVLPGSYLLFLKSKKICAEHFSQHH